MRVVWLAQASQSWQDEAQFLFEQWGLNYVRKFSQNTKKAERQLKAHPQSGPFELLLEGRDKEYHYLFVLPYIKLIYTVQNDNVYISDVWDTRREPQMQADRL